MEKNIYRLALEDSMSGSGMSNGHLINSVCSFGNSQFKKIFQIIFDNMKIIEENK